MYGPRTEWQWKALLFMAVISIGTFLLFYSVSTVNPPFERWPFLTIFRIYMSHYLLFYSAWRLCFCGSRSDSALPPTCTHVPQRPFNGYAMPCNVP